MRVKNQGTNPVAGFSIAYTHKNREEYNGSVSIPANDTIFPSQEKEYSFSINYDFTGTDTMLVYIVGDYGEQDFGNDTLELYMDIWPESTVAASNFPDSTVFPPKGWERISYCVHGYNWEWSRYAIIYGDEMWEIPPDEPFEIDSPFVGLASFPCWYALPYDGDSTARLISHTIGIGERRRLVARYYMLKSNVWGNINNLLVFEKIISGDTLFAGVDSNNIDPYITDSMIIQWVPCEILLGDIPSGTTLKVSLKARSGWGQNFYIDSLWIYAAQPGAIFTFDPQSDYGRIPETDSWWFRIKVSENNYGFLADTLYYQVLNTKQEWSGVTHDSVVATATPGDSFYYYTVTIPGASSSTKLRFYFRFIENSRWEYAINYPDTGYIEIMPLGIEVNLPKTYQFSIKSANLSKGPFEFSYALPERSNIEISVYSVTGQKVATLCKDIKDAGYYSVRWNGRSDSGSSLSSGIYIIKMVTPKKSFTTRVILTK